MEIVFVVLVNFQPFVLDNIENCKRFGNHNITVLTDSKFSHHFDNICQVVTVESLIQHYEEFANGLQNTFWNGFYELTSYRFFVLYQYILQHNRGKLLHLENDVMIFQDFNEFSFHDMTKILITMDNNERCIPGIVYIPHAASLKTCYDLFDKNQSDMYNWAKCYYQLREENIIDTLPIFVDNHAHCENKILTNAFPFYHGIFDGAALGQYLGGIDPRNNPHDDPKNKEGVVSVDCMVDYSNWKIIWKQSPLHFYEEPFIIIDHIEIKIFNLHVHCKDLKKFLREPKLPTVISGERIQSFCDFYIGTHEQIHANPLFREDISLKKHKYIDEEPIDFSGKEVRSIFCFTNILHSHFDALCRVLQTIETPFYVYFHNSDFGFHTHHTSLLSNPNIQGIYTQNLETAPTDRLKPLPIGIANSMYSHGNLSIWDKMLRIPCIKKTEKVYSQFSIDTNVLKRMKCFDIVTSKGIPTQLSCHYYDYLELLSTFEFAICPEGNGIDTHRFWECLYLKTVPICLKNPVTEYFSQFFPVVLLDSWEELDVTQLVYSPWPSTYAEMIDVVYWQPK